MSKTAFNIGDEVSVRVGERKISAIITGFPRTNTVSVKYSIQRRGSKTAIPGAGVFPVIDVELIKSHTNTVTKQGD